MLGYQYREDVQAVADAAYNYAKSTPLIKDFRNTWIFDLGDTVLSSFPYYAQPDIAFGGTKYNSTKFAIWVKKGISPAVPGVLDLYKKLQSLGYKIVLISGRSESLRAVTIKNLKNLGFTNWEKLILKQTSDAGTTLLVFKEKKRNELIAQDYRIIGNVGDQWSDIMGEHVGYWTFKVPNQCTMIS
ncbi:acid phosphatase 1-like [Quercus suber]|uniref:Acid phosphatase 1 n=1 Tax=Quercus suber TaxID=58331 RepID=A0AAW0M453_QUESU|nr:acid phosphatase 1 [Quercus suber]